MTTSSDFKDWLLTQIQPRGWRLADLARHSGVRYATLNHIFSGTRGIGPDVCRALAHALGLPAETVFRQTGLLPAAPDLTAIPEPLAVALVMLTALPPSEQQLIGEFIQWRYTRQPLETTQGKR